MDQPLVVIHEAQIPGAIWVTLRSEVGTVEVMASADLRASTVVLYQVHLGGLAPGALGAGNLRRLGQRLADFAGQSQGADYVVIIGGMRTTGAHAGRFPRPRVFDVAR